jgi:hypothetical protein
MPVCVGGFELLKELTRESGDKLDQIGLAGSTGLCKNPAAVSLYGGFSNPECLGDFGVSTEIF